MKSLTNINNSYYFHKEYYWSDVWTNHIENYLNAPPRCGYWLNSQFKNCDSTLEVAAGSCRDSFYLSEIGKNAIASDFDQKTIDYLKNKYPHTPLVLQREDAFALSLPNKSIDLVFSNGFFVLFSKNEEIHNLIQEQARVARKYIVVLVHNNKNFRLKKLFKEKSKNDDLYKIRFFDPEEIKTIIKDSGIKYKSLRLEKFGGPLDRLYLDTLLHIKNPFRKLANKITPHSYKIQPWITSERIACIIELPQND